MRSGPRHIGSNPNRTEFWVKGKKRREEQTVEELRPRTGRQHSVGLVGHATYSLEREEPTGAQASTWSSTFSVVGLLHGAGILGAKVVPSSQAHCLHVSFLSLLTAVEQRKD